MEATIYEFLYHYFVREYFNLLGSGQKFKSREMGKKYLNQDLIPPLLRHKLRVLYEITERGNGMNIFSVEGCKLICNGSTAADFSELRRNAERYLREGWVYTVKTTIPFDSFTLVEIKEFPGIPFNSAAFSKCEETGKGMDELLEDYGPDLEADLEKVKETYAGHEKWLGLSDADKLKRIYEHIKNNGAEKLDIFALADGYLKTEKYGEPKFSVGDRFIADSVIIEILAVSDIHDDEGIWHYFAKVITANNSVWYNAFDQLQMNVLRIADADTDFEALTETEKVMRNIMNVTAGVMNSRYLTSRQCPPLNLVCNPAFEAGQIFEDDIEILCVSPSMDCNGCWVYFCKETAFGGERVVYYAMDEEGLKSL